MKKYTIRFQTTADLLPTIVSLLSDTVGALIVEEVAATQKPAAKAFQRTKTGTTRITGNHDISKQPSVMLALACLRAGQTTYAKIKAAMVADHYSPNTAGATLSKMRSAGLIVFENGAYREA